MLQFKILYVLLVTSQLYYPSHHHHYNHHTAKLPITPDVRITRIAASEETLCSDCLSSAVRQISFVIERSPQGRPRIVVGTSSQYNASGILGLRMWEAKTEAVPVFCTARIFYTGWFRSCKGITERLSFLVYLKPSKSWAKAVSSAICDQLLKQSCSFVYHIVPSERLFWREPQNKHHVFT